jgi:hypothetical protein
MKNYDADVLILLILEFYKKQKIIQISLSERCIS